MVAEIFTALLFPSLAGACLAAVILLLRPLTRKVFGYSWHYYIWLAVLIAMLLPVRFSMPQAANTIPAVSSVTQTEQTAQTAQVQNTVATAPAPQAKPGTTLLQAGTGFIKSVVNNRMNIIAYVWLAGAVILLLTHLAGYIRLVTKMRKASVPVSCPELAAFTKRKVSVRLWGNTSSPFLVGIVKPTLVLPAREFTEEQLNNILRHEMTHLKRHDILYKWAAVFVKCLHWFNPVIWVVTKQMNAECEISCDMAVTRNLSRDEEMSYIDTLLSLLPMGKTRQIPLTTQMASSKKILKRRFIMIKNKRTTNKIISALSAVVAIAMLSTTVFASGVLSGLTEDTYTVEITNNGEVIELVNKPFIENGVLYVPLREAIEKTDTNAVVEWNDGSISVDIIGNKYLLFIDDKAINVNPVVGPTFSVNAYDAPLLIGSVSYMPFETLVYLFTYDQNNTYSFDYDIYDKDGNPINVIDFYQNVENLSKDDMKNLQAEVDNGHYPWRLDPQQVILAFMDQRGLSGGEIQALAGGGTVSASYVHNSGTYDVELYRPIYQNEHGILVVKSCAKRP